jgi:hypothetical protein
MCHLVTQVLEWTRSQSLDEEGDHVAHKHAWHLDADVLGLVIPLEIETAHGFVNCNLTWEKNQVIKLLHYQQIA